MFTNLAYFLMMEECERWLDGFLLLIMNMEIRKGCALLFYFPIGKENTLKV